MKTRTSVCALALAAVLGLTACGTDHEEIGVKEPAREGLDIEIAGIDYNVFLTRELNLAITPDKDYYDGPEAQPGHALFGVFIQVCNRGDEEKTTASSFKVLDNQDNEFEPIELPEDNAFAYTPRRLGEGDCIPEDGSVAQLGPTAGSLLVFNFPLPNTEFRPLELEITGYEAGKPVTKTFELDL